MPDHGKPASFDDRYVTPYYLHLMATNAAEADEVVLREVRVRAGELSVDPEEIRETTISDDKKTITTRDYAACIAGWIEHTWSLTPEDPKGAWEITVAIEGYETQVFRPRFVGE